VTSYAEVVVSDEAEDQRIRRSASSRGEHIEDLGALVFHRRPRSGREPDAWLAHMMVLPGERARLMGYESSRERFVGRGRTARRPGAFDRERLTGAGMTGATLDPVMALSAEIELPGHRTTTLGYVVWRPAHARAS
jgi:cyclic beta-1,2-glucan synthetase